MPNNPLNSFFARIRMRKNTHYLSQVLTYLLLSVVPLTIILYIFRGLGIIAFMPGGLILFLIILSAFTVIFYLIDKTY